MSAFRVGILVSHSIPSLGASLDRGVNDSRLAKGDESGILKVKFAHSEGIAGLSVIAAMAASKSPKTWLSRLKRVT